jgi:hypothetical protein
MSAVGPPVQVIFIPVPVPAKRPWGFVAGNGWLGGTRRPWPAKQTLPAWRPQRQIPSQQGREILEAGRRYLEQRRSQRVGPPLVVW